MTLRVWLARGSLLALGLVSSLLYAPSAHADLYGRGNYNSCGYQYCPTPTAVPSGTPAPGTSVAPAPSATPPAVTVDTSPDGLEFAVNLSDGQIIPSGTYTVTVTPLNGQGRTFSKVEIYLDGALAASVLPATTGTFYWNWQTGNAPTRLVKIITFDQDGATTSKEFNISIRNATPAAIVNTGGNSGITERIVEITQAGAEAVTRAVKQIPVPVANAFPYLLFALLGSGLLLLVFQARREIAAAAAMAAIIARERAIAADKDTFVQLASHYLRTPLTVIANGIDLGVSLKQIDQPQSAALKTLVNELRTKIEQLLNTSVATPVTAPEQGRAMHAKIWLRPSFFLPIILLGALTLTFNMLVIQVGKINVSMINLITQIVMFGLLALGLYMLLRSQTLRRRDTAEYQRIRDEQIRVDEARNQLIIGAITQLTTAVNGISEALPQLGDSQAARLISQGSDRFRRTLAKFGAAARLQTGHSEAPAQQFQLSQLIDQSMASSAKAAQEKKLSIMKPENKVLTAKHPDWLKTVLASLIDNAVAYSSPGGELAIVVESGAEETSISVIDHGRGIAPATQRQLFRPFAKVEGALTFDNEGMGFSLYLDKLIMTYIGGDIMLTSKLGEGTTATVRLFNQPQNRPEQTDGGVQLSHERLTAKEYV